MVPTVTPIRPTHEGLLFDDPTDQELLELNLFFEHAIVSDELEDIFPDF